MNTIGDMQNEMDFFGRCKKFEYNHDFDIFFLKIVYDTLECVVLNNIVYLLFGVNTFTIYKVITIFNKAQVITF